MLRLGAFVPVPPHLARRRTHVGVLALVTIVALAFLLDLGRPAFWDPGESRYAETAREMLLSGNFVAPTLGFVRYYDKPPGYFWIVAAAFTTLGRNEWAARLPAAVAAVLTIALVVAFAWRRLGARTALGAGAVLATAIQFVVLGRSVRMDMLLTLLTTATVLPAFALFEPRRQFDTAASRPNWPLYVFPAIGLLIKGPVALLLPLMILGAFWIATRTPPRRAQLRPGLGSLMVLGALTLWYVIAAVYSPDYLWTFLWQHNLGRFMGRALAGHREPLWFYVWILPLTFLPWTLFLPGAFRHAYRRARRGERLMIFLCAWCVVPFVFFSLSRAKLATYLLPIFPALALLVAAYLDRVLRAPAPVRARALRIPLLIWSAGMAAVALGTPIGVAAAYSAYAMAALPALGLAIFPLLGWRVARHAQWRVVPALVLAGALTLQMLFYRSAAPVVDDFSSLRDAAEIARELPESAPVFAYKSRGHSFTYYGGRTLLRVRSPAAAAEVLGRSVPTAALVKKRHLEKIRSQLQKTVWIWWQSPSGRVLLANIPRPDHASGELVPPSPPSLQPPPEPAGEQ